MSDTPDTPDTPPRAEPDWYDWRSCLTWLKTILTVEEIGEQIDRGTTQVQTYVAGKVEPTPEARLAILRAARRFRGDLLGAEAAGYQQALREALPELYEPTVYGPHFAEPDDEDADPPPPTPAQKARIAEQLAKLKSERRRS